MADLHRHSHLSRRTCDHQFIYFLFYSWCNAEAAARNRNRVNAVRAGDYDVHLRCEGPPEIERVAGN